MTVLRMWAFADGADQWHAVQPALGLLDEDVLTCPPPPFAPRHPSQACMPSGS